MKKKLTALVLALCLVLMSVSPALAAEFNLDTLNGVVVVREDIVLDGEWLGYGTGTGFFVGERGKSPQYLITNFHVIELFLAARAADGKSGKGASMLQVIYGKDDAEEAYVVDYSEDMDIAILKIGNPTDKRAPLSLQLPTEKLVGTTVYAVGYPAVVDAAVNAVTVYGKEDASVTSGSISRLVTESGSGRKVFQMDVSIHGGNSGGPLVTSQGHVVGINTFGITDENGLPVESVNYALRVDDVTPLLNKNGIAYTIAPEGSSLWLLLVAAAAAVIVVVVILLLNRGKGKKTASAPVPAAQPEAAPAPPPQPKQSPLIRSLAAQHGGAVTRVAGQGVLIGRDLSSCQIVFLEGTPGVSARHCSVAWDGKSSQFQLTDLKSSYGTFLSNGQKLTPGMACQLRAGDVFYLGERDNALRVELE